MLGPDRLKDCLNRSSENNRDAKENWEKYIGKHLSFTYGEDRADEWEFAYLPADKEEREELSIPKLPLVLDFPHITRRVAAQRSRFVLFGEDPFWLEKEYEEQDFIKLAGQRRKLSLGTPMKATAVDKARDIYISIIHDGWEPTLAALHGLERPPRTDTTVGQFLEELAARADLKPETFKGYAIAFRAIIEDVFKIEGGKEKFDHRGGGRSRWIAKINAVRLAEVTPERVQAWKRAFIARAGNDPLKQRSARTSFNSLVRRSMSLFSPKAIKHL